MWINGGRNTAVGRIRGALTACPGDADHEIFHLAIQVSNRYLIFYGLQL
ncbi:hypothetical protein PhaeoP97_00555 [Phaeobacter porticola]|uniref:Uncharacterized protein n=1 Tax=Phaeobacter porticola TaxID=1844006 RepID=A0A1L3I1J3_9RHOB|nr:hypothetical protein PhaeoP97_00555 [Phaeobacter porticola]